MNRSGFFYVATVVHLIGSHNAFFSDEIAFMRKSGKKCELESLVSRSFDYSLISSLSDFLVVIRLRLCYRVRTMIY